MAEAGWGSHFPAYGGRPPGNFFPRQTETGPVGRVIALGENNLKEKPGLVYLQEALTMELLAIPRATQKCRGALGTARILYGQEFLQVEETLFFFLRGCCPHSPSHRLQLQEDSSNLMA